ncbi:MAG TPA: type VI secretion system baseplate subunit TssF, partial [Thermoanaerobaculia bacterium]|nr:type VI secretion system baseplate subunit TssF [Thermoanaerobaculia bacterium]
FELTTPAVATIYAQTLCTNRRLAERLWAGYPLHCDRAVPARIVCLGKPTPQLSPPTDGATLWRLISHLSVNYLSFDAGESRPGEPESPSLLALREMLRLYAFSDRPTIERQIDGIVGMSTRKVVRRMGENPWRGFCRGTEVTLVLDENAFVGASATLFATVLHRFFALYVSLNSFTELVVRRSRQPDQEWQRWPPIAGEQNVL